MLLTNSVSLPFQGGWGGAGRSHLLPPGWLPWQAVPFCTGHRVSINSDVPERGLLRLRKGVVLTFITQEVSTVLGALCLEAGTSPWIRMGGKVTLQRQEGRASSPGTPGAPGAAKGRKDPPWSLQGLGHLDLRHPVSSVEKERVLF